MYNESLLHSTGEIKRGYYYRLCTHQQFNSVYVHTSKWINSIITYTRYLNIIISQPTKALEGDSKHLCFVAIQAYKFLISACSEYQLLYMVTW